MEPWMRNLPDTSNALDAEVLAQYRRCTSAHEVERWLNEEFTQFAHTPLETTSSLQQEDWLKRLFISLRLYRLAQVGETALMVQSPASPRSNQAGQVEVLDILVEQDDWARLCVLGAGTYEMLLHRLRALAMMESTLTISWAEYVTRFCTEHERFSEPQASVNAERNWLPLLLSLRNALKTSPLLKKVVAPIAHKVERRARPSSKQIQYPPVFASWPERIVSFGCAFGIVLVGFAIVFISPAWYVTQIKQTTQVRAARSTSAVPPTFASPLPTELPTAQDTSTPVASAAPIATPSVATPMPTATPTPTVTPAPVPTPTPVEALVERAGFFVIGMAAREEANAQAEAQKHRAEGLNPRVVYSSKWSGLTPNYYQVVYGIFANRSGTTALRKELEQRGIKTYVMHSGQRVRP